jgi:hypothetical protein
MGLKLELKLPLLEIDDPMNVQENNDLLRSLVVKRSKYRDAEDCARQDLSLEGDVEKTTSL